MLSSLMQGSRFATVTRYTLKCPSKSSKRKIKRQDWDLTTSPKIKTLKQPHNRPSIIRIHFSLDVFFGYKNCVSLHHMLPPKK